MVSPRSSQTREIEKPQPVRKGCKCFDTGGLGTVGDHAGNVATKSIPDWSVNVGQTHCGHCSQYDHGWFGPGRMPMWCNGRHPIRTHVRDNHKNDKSQKLGQLVERPKKTDHSANADVDHEKLPGHRKNEGRYNGHDHENDKEYVPSRTDRP